jgi:hypothetical protein
MDTLCDPKDAN